MKDQTFYKLLEKKGALYSLIRFGLFMLSLLYGFVVKVRHSLYSIHLLKANRVDIPVISIGNIVLGGAGKTPLTEFVARMFSKDCKVAILSRGYRRASKDREVVTVSRGNGPLLDASQTGDEPFLLAKHLPNVSVYVHSNRYKAAQKAIKEGAELLILDDGFQHRSLARSEDWVVIGGKHPLGRQALFPRGTLREPLGELKRASAIYMNESIATDALFKKICAVSSCPIIKTKTQFTGCFDLTGNQHVNIEDRKVAAFCGIGNPGAFYQLLHDAKADLVLTKNLSDHQAMHIKQLQDFAKEAIAKGAEMIICTEKDSVKYPHDIDLGIELLWASISLEISDDSKEAFECVQQRVRLKN